MRTGQIAPRWPADHYGGWERVVQAAIDLYRLGCWARVPQSLHHAFDHPEEYVMEEVFQAIVDTFEALGRWPAKQEYLAWAELERRAFRETVGARLQAAER